MILSPKVDPQGAAPAAPALGAASSSSINLNLQALPLKDLSPWKLHSPKRTLVYVLGQHGSPPRKEPQEPQDIDQSSGQSLLHFRGKQKLAEGTGGVLGLGHFDLDHFVPPEAIWI
jgi:hypothetical protein